MILTYNLTLTNNAIVSQNNVILRHYNVKGFTKKRQSLINVKNQLI